MNVLAIGAHFDDIELGCGGALLQHRKHGDLVTMLVLSDSAYQDPDGREVRTAEQALEEGKQGAACLGAELISLGLRTFEIPDNEESTAKILRVIQERKIDTLYTHWPQDAHRDHRHTANASLMAAKALPRVLCYRPNYYDSGVDFNGHYYVDISDVLEKKIEAIEAHKSELNRVGSKWNDFVRADAALNGLAVGVKYAERFQIVRFCQLHQSN